jgi:uncharacterized membrane protein YraQ (UPF0718 family)/copper chaperone CopZ
MLDAVWSILSESWFVLGQMAPYLLLGFLIAGLLAVLIPPSWVERHLGRPGFGAVLKAALIGVPLPLCSCAVLPVAASIRRHGASRAATASFLLSTPQTGVDSISVTYALLGPLFAVFRPVVALLTGLLGGGLVQLFGQRDGEPQDAVVPGAEGSGCTDSCCAGGERQHALRRALRHGFVTLPRDIAGPLLLGALIAGAIGVLASPGRLEPYLGGGPLAIALMMAVGIPIYVCASGSVPLAVGFMHLGASPGAAFAFLVAGPATNAAAVAAIWKLLGRRTAIVYLLTIAAVAFGGGLALDGLFAVLDAPLPQLGGHAHDGPPGWPSHLWAATLVGVHAIAYLAGRRGAKAAAVRVENDLSADSQRIELEIAGMHCGHCAATVGAALRALPGVTAAEVTLQPGRAVVAGRGLDPAQLIAAVAQLGYEAHTHA